MKIIYRISDVGYNKVKPDYINNRNCLVNAVNVFKNAEFHVIADSCSEETLKMIVDEAGEFFLDEVKVGNGAGTFNLALNKALNWDDEEIVYFIENDYIHLPNSQKIIEEGFKLGAPYVTLYLHPDKFISPQYGGNPEVDETGGYLTRIYRGGNGNIFFQVNSTTMTFSCKVKTLREDEEILRKWTAGTHPDDFRMFLELRDKGRVLLCPTNTYSTHGESRWLAPLYNTTPEKLEREWSKHI